MLTTNQIIKTVAISNSYFNLHTRIKASPTSNSITIQDKNLVLASSVSIFKSNSAFYWVPKSRVGDHKIYFETKKQHRLISTAASASIQEKPANIHPKFSPVISAIPVAPTSNSVVLYTKHPSVKSDNDSSTKSHHQSKTKSIKSKTLNSSIKSVR